MSSRVVIAGGGVAGLEALMALHDLAGSHADLTLIAPRPDFVHKPLLVEEPFGRPAERHELAPLAEEFGASFTLGGIRRVRRGEHALELEDGSEVAYDQLFVCVGGRFEPALDGALTFPSATDPLDANVLLERAAGEDGRAVFVVPVGVTWALPLYELALMTARRARESGSDVKFAIVTPEPSPLAVFGPGPSAAVAELLEAAHIEVFPRSTVRELDPQGIRIAPHDRVLSPAVAVALPLMKGPWIDGLPSDSDGFIPIDEYGRVAGLEDDDHYAAGDGTNFPVKQGGLATQQADAAAAHLAHRLGAAPRPEPFKPVLRGKLLTGGQSLSLSAKIAGGEGEGTSSPDGLWWPPGKISARYLSQFLERDASRVPDPPSPSIDVELALPADWHEHPDSLDPLWPPEESP